MRKVLVPVLASMFFMTCFAAVAQPIDVHPPKMAGFSPDGLTEVSRAVQALVDEQKVVGASVLVARHGRAVYFETFGLMDREAAKPMRKDAIFRIYSMTKPITSVATLMLVEAGKIDLDAPISTYIPQFAGLKVYNPNGADITPEREMTPRDLLRHTSGLTYGFFGDSPVDQMYMEENLLDRQSTLQAMIESLSAIPLLHPPGTTWHYGISTDVLGYLVQTVSGMPLDEFFRTRIFEPLGMRDTGFYVPANKAGRLVVCYTPAEDGGLTVLAHPWDEDYRTPPTHFSGGGGLVSTMHDYLRFCQMLENGGAWNGQRLLEPETVALMTQDQLPPSTSWNGEGFGLGFSVINSEGAYGAGEYGWGGAASTHFWIHPKHDLIVIALSQRMPYTSQLENTVKPLVYEALAQ